MVELTENLSGWSFFIKKLSVAKIFTLKTSRNRFYRYFLGVKRYPGVLKIQPAEGLLVDFDEGSIHFYGGSSFGR